LACSDAQRTPTGPTAAPSTESSKATQVQRPSARTINPRPAPTSGAATRIVNIGQTGNSFTDSQSGGVATTIHPGDTVQWRWVGGTHSTTSGMCTTDYYGGGENCNPDGRWDSSTQSPPSTFSKQFNTVGTYRYFCSVHGGSMTGTVVVAP